MKRALKVVVPLLFLSVIGLFVAYRSGWWEHPHHELPSGAKTTTAAHADQQTTEITDTHYRFDTVPRLLMYSSKSLQLPPPPPVLPRYSLTQAH